MTNMPIKNQVYDKILSQGSLTDDELMKALVKDGVILAEDRFNKLLLDLEIQGLISVAWLTKDTRRIEIVVQKTEEDEIEQQNKEMMEKDYESSFPGEVE